MASSSESVKKNFDSNEFSVTRQVRYFLTNKEEEIDMVLFVNGLPFSTMELKNHWTGQNAKEHGQNQYKYKRDISQPLLQFGRCIVHFVVDTDEVYMTTRLNGKDTFFLPFNVGHNHGKGNPPNPFGHRTTYLWADILTRQSVANIIQHFVRFDGKDTDPLSKKTLYFPRYQQLDVLRKLVADASTQGVGQTYLIQHSAGSGKSNSITWAAYQLIETYPATEGIPGSRGMSNPLFDSVIVVTDRRLLDKQLRENIKEFSEVKNIVAPAYSSSDLKSALESASGSLLLKSRVLDMATHNYLAHVDSKGYGVNFYINKAGYSLRPEWLKNPKSNYFESCNGGGLSGEEAILMLINDDDVPTLDHRKHLLGMDNWSGSLVDVGIGYVHSNSNTFYKTYTCVIIAKHDY